MRVAVLGFGDPATPGGANRYVSGLVAGLREAGHEVRLVTAGEGPLPSRVLRYARAARRTARGADVVVANFALYALLPVVTGALRGRRLVVVFHGPWAAESVAAGERGAKVRAKAGVERVVYAAADRLVVLSREFRDLLVTTYRVDPATVEVVPPGVDLARFSPGDREVARERFGLGERERVAVTVRRLVPRMGVDVLLRAWEGVEATLLVAGEGPERARLEPGAPDRVRWLGRVPEDALPDLYRAADVAVVPSVALEGFGLVVLEALACGTPVVASRLGGMGETLPRFDPSLVVPPGDAAALRDRLLRALGGEVPPPDECRGFAEEFSWRAAAEAVVR